MSRCNFKKDSTDEKMQGVFELELNESVEDEDDCNVAPMTSIHGPNCNPNSKGLPNNSSAGSSGFPLANDAIEVDHMLDDLCEPDVNTLLNEPNIEKVQLSERTVNPTGPKLSPRDFSLQAVLGKGGYGKGESLIDMLVLFYTPLFSLLSSSPSLDVQIWLSHRVSV